MCLFVFNHLLQLLVQILVADAAALDQFLYVFVLVLAAEPLHASVLFLLLFLVVAPLVQQRRVRIVEDLLREWAHLLQLLQELPRHRVFFRIFVLFVLILVLMLVIPEHILVRQLCINLYSGYCLSSLHRLFLLFGLHLSHGRLLPHVEEQGHVVHSVVRVEQSRHRIQQVLVVVQIRFRFDVLQMELLLDVPVLQRRVPFQVLDQFLQQVP